MWLLLDENGCIIGGEKWDKGGCFRIHIQEDSVEMIYI
jgi:hypothetical protein